MVFHTNHFLVFSRHQNKPYEAALSPPFEGQPPCAGSSHIPNIHAKCLVCDALRPWEWVLALPLTGTEASFGRTRAPEGISPGPVPQAAPRPRPRQALLARDPTLWLLQRLGIAGTRTPPPTARPRASSEALQASPSGPALRPTAVPLERPLTATHRPPAVLNSCFDNRSGRDRTPGRPCAAAHARTTSWAALWTASDPPAAASAIPESRLPMSRPAGGGRGAEQKQEEGKEK